MDWQELHLWAGWPGKGLDATLTAKMTPTTASGNINILSIFPEIEINM